MGNDLFPMGRDGSGRRDDFPVEVKFGEAAVAIGCATCKGIKSAGFYVTYSGRTMLCCIHCILGAITKYQEMHPTEKLVDVDADVDDAAYKSAVDALRGKYPDFDESKALDIAKAVIQAIG